MQFGRKSEASVSGTRPSSVILFFTALILTLYVSSWYSDSGDVKVTKGFYTPTGPRCTFNMMDGIRAGRCLDGESLDNQPGGPVQVFPCTKRWNQFLSFGNGEEVPSGAIHTTVPLHFRKRIESTGRKQEPYMCLGVAMRGNDDEEDWFDERTEFFESYEDFEFDEESEGGTNETDTNVTSDTKDATADNEDSDERLRPLVYWLGKHLMATKCSNQGAVIEWVLVPFIEEEENGEASAETAVNSTDSTLGGETDGDEEEL